MIPEGYVQALADYADSKDTDAELVAERDALFAKKIANGGKGALELIDAELRAKKFGYQVSMTVEEKFTCLCEAIKLYNSDTVAMTYGAFSYLQR